MEEFKLELNPRSMVRVAALLANRDAVEETLQKMVAAAQQCYDATNRALNDALTNLCETGGHDLPSRYDLTIDTKAMTITIRPTPEPGSMTTPVTPPGFTAPPPPPFPILEPTAPIPSESEPTGRGNGTIS